MRKRTILFVVLAVFAATFATSGPLGAQTDELETRSGPDRAEGNVSPEFELRSLDDVVQVFIQLSEPAVAEVAAEGADPAAQRAQGQEVLDQQAAVRADLGGLIENELSNLVVGANGFRAEVRVGDIPAIRATDEVESVATVTRYFLDNETSVPWIGGDTVQAAGHTGAGTTIAIIDTGIDYTHSALGGSGNPTDYENNDPGIIEAGTFPTTKVVGGFDFAGPTYDASDPALDTPSPDPDPLDVHGHGTHVSGTAAGIDDAGTDDVGTGMAPDAELLALKVFGDVAGSTDLVSDAIERALDPNNDLSTDDAVDVINMSLGSPYGHPQDPSAISSQNAVDLGVVVVASAGNSGPLPYVTGSPAVADGVISVAASIDGEVTVLAMTVNSPPAIQGDYEAQPGDFGDLSPDTTGDLEIADPLDACGDSLNNDLTGNIAYIQRGTCSFSEKIRNAEDAGAIGALVFNNVAGAPIAMAQDGTPDQPDIPAMMIGLADGEAILDVADDPQTVNVTLTDDVVIPKPELADNLASFTSRGPGFGNVFKPDVSAPGFNIFSADVSTGTGGVLSSGTSMAAPHVAGAAAQMLHADPSLTPAEVKALLMGSAEPATVEGPTFEAGAVPVALQGTGIVHVDRAVLDLEAYASPAGLSMGRLNPTTGGTETATVDLNRLTGDSTYSVTFEPNQTLAGVSWSLSDSSVTTSGGSGSVDVSVTLDPAAMDSDDGFYSQAESDGWLVFTNDGNADDVIRVGVFAVVDPASTVTVEAGSVLVSNDGPGDGFADGFTNATGGEGTLARTGYRTTPGAGFDGSDLIELAVALNEPWSGPSGIEVNAFLDVDQDGTDDFLMVAADLGFLTDTPAFGQVVTAMIALDGSFATLLYFGVADMNDEVMFLPFHVDGPFGFLADGDTTFDITVAVFDQLGLAGFSETESVDLDDEVTSPDGLSLVVPAGTAAEIETEGAGNMLWVFQNNAVGDQADTVVITPAPAPPPPPPPSDGPPEPPPLVSDPPDFNDVPDSHLFHTEITWLAEHGITKGCNPPDNDMFCPEDPVSRGQMAAFINRALQLAATGDDFFVDDDGNTFEGDINRLAAAGITRGCNPPVNDEFCVDDDITRAQMATFMIRGWELTDGAGANLFVDDDGNTHENDIDILGTSGVTKGCNPPVNDMYCPDDSTTRGQMAAFIYRAFVAVGTGP